MGICKNGWAALAVTLTISVMVMITGCPGDSGGNGTDPDVPDVHKPGSDVPDTPEVKTYTVTVPGTIIGGSITADPASAEEGKTITLTITPSSGYSLDTLTAQQTGGATIVTIDGTDNIRTFTMPAYNVTVSGNFKLNPNTIAVLFEGFGDETINLSGTGSTLSLSDGDAQITITVTGNYDSYYWNTDGGLRYWGVENSISVEASDFNNVIGLHTITAIVVKDNVPYSKTLIITVVR